jgi:hypothetical protein
MYGRLDEPSMPKFPAWSLRPRYRSGWRAMCLASARSYRLLIQMEPYKIKRKMAKPTTATSR